MQRPRLDLPGTAWAALSSDAKPIIIAVSAMFDMTTEITAQIKS